MSMRKRISLFIASQMVDLDDQSFILFNYTQEDLTNPTIIRNSFSKTITLKGSPTNNKVFGDAFRVDRKTLYGTKYLGAYFDASRRTPFTIYNEMNEVLESGYCKLDNIKRDGVSVEYQITLYGGLGAFFYNLAQNEDGTERTLASMRYKLLDGTYTRIPGGFGQVGGYVMLQDAWSYLSNPNGYDLNANDCWWADIVNFAPCYNGLPTDFSANTALVHKSSFANMPPLFPRGDATFNLMKMANSHSEWEMKDLRWYLQRPVFRVKALFDAICDEQNNGGYSVSLSPSFFKSSNPLYWDSWITLPLIPAEDRLSNTAIPKLLAQTKSVADYLLSFAKIFGLVFLSDRDKKHISIMPRNEFFKNEIIDLTKRINKRDITISPIVAQSHFYQFGADSIGAWAEDYKTDFGRDYGVQIINTGNEFNADKSVVTEEILYKDAVEVQERNLLFVTSVERSEVSGTSSTPLFRLPLYEAVSVQQWTTGNEPQMTEEAITLPYEGFLFFDNQDFPLSDWLPKVQYHDKSDKSVDGANCLLVFNGMKETPVWKSWARLEYRLTDDIDDMSLLNEGVPCWNFTDRNSKILTSLPSFRRCCTRDENGEDVITATWEWGEPSARGVNNVFHQSDPATLYNRWWKKYLSDRYDDDTFLMSCKVDLRGLLVGQDLLGKFFYYDGAIFVLNKISNHSLTTWDDTECEFIKVQDINNYIG